MNWVLVIVGGMVGAPLRYLTDRAVQSRHATDFPWGTFTVNVAGSFVLGLLTGAVTAGAATSHLRLLLGTGLCGALTTYSTFSYETLRLARDRRPLPRRRQRGRERDGGAGRGLRGAGGGAGPLVLSAGPYPAVVGLPPRRDHRRRDRGRPYLSHALIGHGPAERNWTP